MEHVLLKNLLQLLHLFIIKAKSHKSLEIFECGPINHLSPAVLFIKVCIFQVLFIVIIQYCHFFNRYNWVLTFPFSLSKSIFQKTAIQIYYDNKNTRHVQFNGLVIKDIDSFMSNSKCGILLILFMLS